MRKMALWHFCFGSGLDTASLALPPFLGRLRDLPAMGVWRSETWHTELLAWPSFMGRFCLGSSLLPDMQGLRFSISSPLSLVCCAQKLFFSCFIYFIQIVRLTVFVTPPALQLCLLFPGMLVEMSVFTLVWYPPLSFLSYPCVWAVGRLQTEPAQACRMLSSEWLCFISFLLIGSLLHSLSDWLWK